MKAIHRRVREWGEMLHSIAGLIGAVALVVAAAEELLKLFR
jgi:hypothetical protein